MSKETPIQSHTDSNALKNALFLHIKNLSDFGLIADTPENELKKLQSLGISLLTPEYETYPKLLREIAHPPKLLYIKGDTCFLNTDQLLAVVGSRNITPYGRQAAARLLTPVCENNIRIVSGLALGVDAYVHSIAVEMKQPTCAVVACGLDEVSFGPKTNLGLARMILAYGGCIISEYPPGVHAQKQFFFVRNRIISGLCPATFVVEAAHKSGSLITSKFALEQNRDVFALPGRISDSTSQGTNQLIHDGATPTVSAETLLSYYGKTKTNTGVNLTPAEIFILDIIKQHGSSDLDTLATHSSIHIPALLSTLSVLELKNKVSSQHGMYSCI